MAQQPPGGGDRREHAERNLAAALARLDREIRELRTGEDWEAALRCCATLPGQSFGNALLIGAQRPGASMVAGYEAWSAMGRRVTRGQKGIAVLTGTARPARAPGSLPGGGTGPAPGGELVRWRLTYVWDISQTTGPAAQGLGIAAGSGSAMPPRVLDALSWAARREGFAIEREDCGPSSGDALIFWNARRIRVRPGLPAAREASAALHQLGHIGMHGHLADPPCATAGACEGTIRVEADSVAFILGVRHGIPVPARFPALASWAGADPRANPERVVRAAGARITAAASRLSAHLAAALPQQSTDPHPVQRPEGPAPELASRISVGQRRAAALRASAEAALAAASTPGRPPVPFSQALADAEEFYLARARARGSWLPAYLRSRGLDEQAADLWRIGYAPAGWTTLTSHLTAAGHSASDIIAAGLARESSRGGLVDFFRDRAMLAVRDEHGTIAGFIGRARPRAGPAVPKYLNSPQTATYSKDEMLLGLHLARPAVAAGATPVLAEGPFDAIAITSCAPGKYAGLAVCGTALTRSQVAALSRLCDLGQRGVIVASDGDQAGRQAAIRAYDTLRAFTARAISVTFPAGQDPAAIFQDQGPAALAAVMRERARPLATLVIEAEIEQRMTGQGSQHERLLAMRGSAQVIAGFLPPGAVSEITALTGRQILRTWTEDLRPAFEPAIEPIARLLPADAISQITTAGDRLGFDYPQVITEVANAAAQLGYAPKRLAGRDRRPDLERGTLATTDLARQLAASSFPDLPKAAPGDSSPLPDPAGRNHRVPRPPLTARQRNPAAVAR